MSSSSSSSLTSSQTNISTTPIEEKEIVRAFRYVCFDSRCGKTGIYPENSEWICPYCNKTNSILIKPYPVGKSRKFTLH